MRTITSANSTFAISVNGLYAIPQNLSGYSTDTAFTTQPLTQAEVKMGVDGHLSSGFVFSAIEQTITLMPDSESMIIFENWMAAQIAIRETYRCYGTIILPALKRKYTLQNGTLVSGYALPDVKRLLEPVTFQIHWERVIGENY